MDTCKKLLSKSKDYLNDNSQNILTGIGIFGMCTAIVQGITATPKAVKKLDQLKEELGLEPDELLTNKEIVQATWKYYVPCAATAAVSAGCLIGSNHISNKKNLAIAAAYSITEKTLSVYKDKLVETLGDEGAKEIQKKVEKEVLSKPAQDSVPMIVSNDGSFVCLDSEYGVYFESTHADIMAAVNAINRMLNVENYASLNDFYYELGVAQNSNGDKVGWNVEDGLIDVNFSASIYKNKPCMVLYYDKAPKEDYKNLH